MQTSDYIASLQSDKENLVSNLNEKGVEATNEETFTSLVPKVLDIKSGGCDFEITDGGYLFTLGYRLNIIDKLLPLCNNITNANVMFSYYPLEDLNISHINLEKLNSGISTMLSYCENLTNLLFGSNLGKGYTRKENNYNSYSLDLSYSTKLTHDSLMDVINKLYDLHLTYSGTLYTQQLILGSTNRAKLTASEIKIATDKGWTIS